MSGKKLEVNASLLSYNEENFQNAQKSKSFDFFSPRSLCVRFLILTITSTFFFTCTNTDAVVSASLPTLREEWGLSTLQLSILYSCAPIMSLVSVFLLSGVLKYIGLRVAALVSCTFLMLGTLVFILVDGYYAKMVGRGLFGLGEGPLEVVMELIAMRWFESGGEEKEDEPSMPPSLDVAFGVMSASGLAGALVSLNLIPVFIDLVGTDTAYMIMAFFPAISLCFAIFYAVLDYWATPILGFDEEFEEEVSAIEVCKSLSAPCWILFLMGGTLWALLYIVLLYLTDYIVEKWDGEYDNIESARFASVAYGLGLLSSLVAGWMVEKFAKPLIMLLAGCLLFSSSCFIISWTNIHPLVTCIAFGVCLGLFEPTLYSCLASVLPEKGSDTAFTWSALVFQVSCFAMPFGFGALHDYFGSYDLVFQICGGIGIFNAGLVILLWYLAPHLQSVNRVVHTHRFFRTVVVLQDKRKLLPPRRHSYNGGELNAIHKILKEKNLEEEIGAVDPLNSHLYLEEPQLVHLLGSPKATSPLAAANNKAFTMPTNYFSKLTEPVIVKYEPVDGTPDKDDVVVGIVTAQEVEPTDEELRSAWSNRG